jgi:hypothetical protein
LHFGTKEDAKGAEQRTRRIDRPTRRNAKTTAGTSDAAERSQTRSPETDAPRHATRKRAQPRARTRRNKLARIVGNRHLHALCVDAALRHGEGLKDK